MNYSRENPINRHGINMQLLKKDMRLKYQAKRFFGVDYEPPLVFEAKVHLYPAEKEVIPFKYAPKSWAIRVLNIKQDERLNDTHIMYRLPRAIDVDDIIEIL